MSELAYRTVVGQRSVAARVLALLYVLAGLTAVAAAVFPVSPAAPIRLALTIGGIEVVAGLALTAYRDRLHPVALHLGLLGRIACSSVLVAVAASGTMVALCGIGFVSLAVFAAAFFPRALARGYAAIGVAGFCIGTVIAGVGNLPIVWLGVGVSAMLGGELLGALITQLRSQAGTDALTGLANRASFRLAADREIAAAARGERALTLALIDLDDFKAINDAHGHLAGDALLIELTRAWNSLLRGTDLLARYGGDEFALLLPSTTPADAQLAFDRLRAAHPMSWSVGVAAWTPGAAIDVLFAEADRELYRAKFERSLAKPSEPVGSPS
jgi:diguanylate cyclase (GGDEF)-like protein